MWKSEIFEMFGNCEKFFPYVKVKIIKKVRENEAKIEMQKHDTEKKFNLGFMIQF